ncbi:hypothetical protein KJ855_01405, partial [Patescibacteria group bacterium]|nr:hypothetical protein [Patescibacteria group bacterium]
MDYFGQKYNLLPGDRKKRQLPANDQMIESWEGNLDSEDNLLKKQKDISKIISYRNSNYFVVFYFFTFVIGLILVGRLWQLQIVKGAESLAKVEGNMINVKTIYAPRGVIYDRHQNIIAGNKSRYDLKTIPAMLSSQAIDRYEQYRTLSQFTGIETTKIREIVEKEGLNNWNEVVIVQNLERDQALQIKTMDINGFYIENISSRQYYCDQECVHIIGYTGLVTPELLAESDEYQPIDQVGKSGLEKFYEKELKGDNGASYQIVDASGKIINTLTPLNGSPGDNIVSTIDIDLQKFIYEQLSQTIVHNSDSTGGAVVVSDPNTGEILSLVNYPSYSANQFSQGISQEEYDILLNDEKLPLFNRAISGEYPPGSTFKIVSSTAILAENLANINTTVVDEGSIRITNKYDPSIIYIFWGWNHAGLGPVNVVDALALSSDIYFYIFGGGYEQYEGLGIDRLQRYAEKYMLSKTL